MATRQQALMIARRQREAQQAQQREQILQQLMTEEVPMELIMDERLPLSDQERQNLWNQRVANQRTATLGVPSTEMFTGTQNQLTNSLTQLARTPQWQAMDDKARIALLRSKFGSQVAERYESSILDRAAVENQRRKTFDDAYETERVMAREQRQSAARLGATEPEMLHRKLLSGDWVVQGGGMFEKNPEYNPANPLTASLPPYLPLSSSGEATVARHWGAVMPGRPNPLNPEKLMRIQVAEENPDLSSEEIIKAAQARLAATMAAKANPARALADTEEVMARRRIAGYQGSIPSAAPTPMSPTYSVESTAPSAPYPSGPALAPTADLRFGQKLNLFGRNAARDIAGFIPAVESRVANLGQFMQRQTANPPIAQFFNDILGRPTTPSAIPELAPIPASQTVTGRLLPDWLK